MTEEPDAPKDYRGGHVSMRVTPAMRTRIDQIKDRLGTANTCEVLRRALDLFERSLDADEVYIIKDGQRNRSVLP